MSNWPLVDERDDGIRPDAFPGSGRICLYCRSEIGAPHGHDCVIVKKVVRMRHSYEIEVEVPWGWDEDSINFYYNGSSSCADNVQRDMAKYKERIGAACDCVIHSAEFLVVVDNTPRRKLVD